MTLDAHVETRLQRILRLLVAGVSVDQRFLRQLWVVGLQDAADRNMLDKPTFKNLNLGLAAIAAGNASALW